jgi:hypothetical protein
MVQEGTDVKRGQIVSVASSALSPTEAAVSDAAKSVFTNSVTATRDYAKFMLPICGGEVPTYLALLKYVGYPPGSTVDLSLLYLASALPAFLFLVAAVVFVFGVMPEHYDRGTLDRAGDVDRLYERVVNGGRTASTAGTTLFVIANIIAIIVVIYVMTH